MSASSRPRARVLWTRRPISRSGFELRGIRGGIEQIELQAFPQIGGPEGLRFDDQVADVLRRVGNVPAFGGTGADRQLIVRQSIGGKSTLVQVVSKIPANGGIQAEHAGNFQLLLSFLRFAGGNQRLSAQVQGHNLADVIFPDLEIRSRGRVVLLVVIQQPAVGEARDGELVHRILGVLQGQHAVPLQVASLRQQLQPLSALRLIESASLIGCFGDNLLPTLERRMPGGRAQELLQSQ